MYYGSDENINDLKVNNEDLIVAEDNKILLDVFSIIMPCVEELFDVYKKILSIQDYCLPTDLSINGITFDEDVQNCANSIQETIIILEEFAKSLISVVDEIILKDFRKKNPEIMRNTSLFKDYSPFPHLIIDFPQGSNNTLNQKQVHSVLFINNYDELIQSLSPFNNSFSKTENIQSALGDGNWIFLTQLTRARSTNKNVNEQSMRFYKTSNNKPQPNFQNIFGVTKSQNGRTPPSMPTSSNEEIPPSPPNMNS